VSLFTHPSIFLPHGYHRGMVEKMMVWNCTLWRHLRTLTDYRSSITSRRYVHIIRYSCLPTQSVVSASKQMGKPTSDEMQKMEVVMFSALMRVLED
jgi:hypothetical protein